MSRTSRRARTVLVLLLAAVGAGCEYFRNSPEQELANQRWTDCAAGLRDVKLDRVDTDGRIHFTYFALNERNRVLECIEAAERDAKRLPEPVASAQAGQ